MSTKFFTNQGDNSLLKKFEGVFSNIDSIRHFDALVGYFRASGYFKIRPMLDKIPRIRILVGINVDQLIKKYHEQGQYFLENPEETKKTFLEELIDNIEEADYDKSTEDGIIQFINDLIDQKIELRAHPKQKIHAKVYIFRPANFNEYAPCEVITGSSNLTNAGLGANPESNYEFNVSLRDYQDVKFATDEFERLWDESIPILQAEAKQLKLATYIRDDFTPFELYIKMLIEYFGKRVEYDPYNIDLLLPDKFLRLKYQSDAANQGFAIMMKHNGFILADVVGLGKTIVACMVIKKFIYENGTHTRILTVIPPALESNWKMATEDFQIKNHFEYITLGSLHRVMEEDDYSYSNADKFDLIVVDESHKFRNDYTSMYLLLQQICKTPRSRRAENGDDRKKVILISATPLNNRPKDIENQLYLFQDRRNSTLEKIRNLQEYFKPINERYKKLSEEKPLNIAKLKLMFQQLRDDVVEPLVIRRTRKDIENNKSYLEDIKAQGISFPGGGEPKKLEYTLDDELSQLFLDTVSLITGFDEFGEESDGLEYYRYRAIEFLAKDKDRKIYGNVGQISGRLSAIMRTLLVKRLESSFHAFKMSLGRFLKAIKNMIEMFDADQIFIAPDLDINKLLAEGYSYEQIEEKLTEKGSHNKKYKKIDFIDTFYDLLKKDQVKVEALLNRWKGIKKDPNLEKVGKKIKQASKLEKIDENIKKDPKLEEFGEKIKKVFFNKKNNPSGKLVIFTESKETAEELKGYLKKISDHRVLCISAKNRKTEELTIRNNFDANLEPEKWQDNFNIIITTEVLAEGINLHRSNVIVNYDVPWNATRLMQRIGRVNRIGSRAKRIYVYNFYPTAQGDFQINLVNTALRKLQAFHTAFGEDNKIFSTLEQEGEGALFGNRIQQEESEILKYLNELRDFKKKHPKRFKAIAKIPHKARCGRKTAPNKQLKLLESDLGEVNYPLKQTSLTYLKSENHPGIFCLITPELNTIELNFLQAVNIYKATEKEKAIPIPPQHHEQVISGLNFFKSEKNQENIRKISRKGLSNEENKAITNLNAILKIAPTEQKRNALIRCLELIKKGTYAPQGPPKIINAFFKQNGNLLGESVQFMDALFEQVLDKLDLSPKDEDSGFKDKPRGIINPKIVLTQSFI